MVKALWRASPKSALKQKTTKTFRWKGVPHGSPIDVSLKPGLTALQMVHEMEKHLDENSKRMELLGQIKHFLWKKEEGNSIHEKVLSGSTSLRFSKKIKKTVDEFARTRYHMLHKNPEYIVELLKKHGIDESNYGYQEVVDYCKGKFVVISDDGEDSADANEGGSTVSGARLDAQPTAEVSPTAGECVSHGTLDKIQAASVVASSGARNLFSPQAATKKLLPSQAACLEPEQSVAPTGAPTAVPTVEPTAVPTVQPTLSPTVEPTVQPSVAPTGAPTAVPTVEPTAVPTVQPTLTPTVEPLTEARKTTKRMVLVRTGEKRKMRVMSADSNSCGGSPVEGRAFTKMSAIELRLLRHRRKRAIELLRHEEEKESQKRPDVVAKGKQAEEVDRTSRPRTRRVARLGSREVRGAPLISHNGPLDKESGGEKDRGRPPPGRRPGSERRGGTPRSERRSDGGAPLSGGPLPREGGGRGGGGGARAAAAAARCAVCGPVRSASEGLQGCTGCQRRYHPLCLGKEDKPGTLLCPVCEQESNPEFFKEFATGFFSAMPPGTPPDAQCAALWRALAGRLRAHAKTFARDLLALAAPAPMAMEAEADACLETALAIGKEHILLSFWKGYLKSIIPDHFRYSFISKAMTRLSLKYVGNAKELSAQQVKSVGELRCSKAQIEKFIGNRMKEWCTFIGQKSEPLIRALKEFYEEDGSKITVDKVLAELATGKLLMEHLSNKAEQQAADAAVVMGQQLPLRSLLYSKGDLVLALWPKDGVFYRARIAAVYFQGILSADQARYDLEYTDGKSEEKKVAPERLLPIENQFDRVLLKKQMALTFFSAIENVKDVLVNVKGDDLCMCKTMHSPKLLVSSNKVLAFEEMPSQSVLVRQQPGKGNSGQPSRPAAVKRRRPAAVAGLPSLFDVIYHDPPAKMEYGVSEWRLKPSGDNNGGASSTKVKGGIASFTSAWGAAAAKGRRRGDAQRATTSRHSSGATARGTRSVQCLCRLRRADGSGALPADLGFLQAVTSFEDGTAMLEGKPAFFVEDACQFPLAFLEKTCRDVLLYHNNVDRSSALCFCRIHSLEELGKAYAQGFATYYMGSNQNLQIFDTLKDLLFHIQQQETPAAKQEARTSEQLDGSAVKQPDFVFILTLTRYHIDEKRDDLHFNASTGRRHPPRRRGYDALNPLAIDSDSLGSPVVLFPKLIFALSRDNLHKGTYKEKKEKDQCECEKEQCSRNEIFGFPGEFSRFCTSKHKMDGMENNPTSKKSRGKTKDRASSRENSSDSSFSSSSC